MKLFKTVSLLSVAALAVLSLQSTSSFARGGGCYGCGYNNGYGDGAADGFAAALLSSYSLLTTDAANSGYDSETLMIEAANYQDTGTKGPVFQAFSDQMAAQMTKELGSDQMSKVDSETLDAMVADRILKDAK